MTRTARRALPDVTEIPVSTDDAELTPSATGAESNFDQARAEIAKLGFTLLELARNDWYVWRDWTGEVVGQRPVYTTVYLLSMVDPAGRTIYCGRGREWDPHLMIVRPFERLDDAIQTAREESARFQADRGHEAQRNGRTT
jgi:hypothetical protein